MQKILVPCNFSVSALRGLEFAVEVAKATSGSIVVLSLLSQQLEDEHSLVRSGIKQTSSVL